MSLSKLLFLEFFSAFASWITSQKRHWAWRSVNHKMNPWRSVGTFLAFQLHCPISASIGETQTIEIVNDIFLGNSRISFNYGANCWKISLQTLLAEDWQQNSKKPNKNWKWLENERCSLKIMVSTPLLLSSSIIIMLTWAFW